ncbi:unnamed protein product [Rotaria socialis]|nr:unnamed protein product [Rotaria socialis]CAF3425056.1 unnamed protein product [Rotaria socialis]CAF3470793.1 unnamed protein product [Rotaria socialis]CAF3538220.1 unnamed protein product [Rotaria socialis]CAF3746712.1 unnamed protein product [Rotaria socialis]
MIRGNTILCVLFTVLVIQARTSIGQPMKPSDLKALLRKALEVDFCARMVPVTRPIPLRFRRTLAKQQFQCLITLD